MSRHQVMRSFRASSMHAKALHNNSIVAKPPLRRCTGYTSSCYPLQSHRVAKRSFARALQGLCKGFATHASLALQPLTPCIEDVTNMQRGMG